MPTLGLDIYSSSIVTCYLYYYSIAGGGGELQVICLFWIWIQAMTSIADQDPAQINRIRIKANRTVPSGCFCVKFLVNDWREKNNFIQIKE